jgi:hypothetical protein
LEDTYRIIQNQIVLFNLISALYYEVTGEVPIVKTNISKDNWVQTSSDLSAISYLGEGLQHPSQHPKEHDRHPEPVCISGAN